MTCSSNQSPGQRPIQPPMPVKYWSKAGLCLTDWCNASCESCYMRCGPQRSTWMSPESAGEVWRQLSELCPHPCQVHLTGGEPFGRPELVLAVLTRGSAMGLAPADVETNAFWAEDDQTVVARLDALAVAGIRRLGVSADPYHQQFVPIDRPRRLVELARQRLGADRVHVRWQDWLDDGVDPTQTDEATWRQVVDEYARRGRDRLTGRGFDLSAPVEQMKPALEFDDNPCREVLLRGRGIHIGPDGSLWPATCVGISVGNVLARPVRQIWQNLHNDWAGHPIIGPLTQRGPVGLMETLGLTPADLPARGFASKCQLCFGVRTVLSNRGEFAEILAPRDVYADKC